MFHINRVSIREAETHMHNTALAEPFGSHSLGQEQEARLQGSKREQIVCKVRLLITMAYFFTSLIYLSPV